MPYFTIWAKVELRGGIKSLGNELLRLLPVLWIIVYVVHANKKYLPFWNGNTLQDDILCERCIESLGQRRLHPQGLQEAKPQVLELLCYVQVKFAHKVIVYRTEDAIDLFKQLFLHFRKLVKTAQ